MVITSLSENRLMLIDYPNEFLINWNIIKKRSSQDKERNFTVYQLVKIHNKFFEGKTTNAIDLVPIEVHI